MKTIVLGFVLFPVLFLACSPDITVVSSIPAASYQGMTRIVSRNRNVILGSCSKSAPMDEKPTITVHFTYDFEIDTVEVTIQ